MTTGKTIALTRWTFAGKVISAFLWRRKWQPTPVLLPGESLGQRSLAGYSPWGRKVGYDWATDTHTKLKRYLMVHFIHSSSSCRKQDGAGSAWDTGWLANPHPFWKSCGLSACNSWPWANKRLSCLKKKDTKNKAAEYICEKQKSLQYQHEQKWANRKWIR